MKKLSIIVTCSLLATTGYAAFNFDREPAVVLPEIMKLKTTPEQLKGALLYTIYNDVNGKTATRNNWVEGLDKVGKTAASSLMVDIAGLKENSNLETSMLYWAERFEKAVTAWYKANPAGNLSSFLSINFDVEPDIFFNTIYCFREINKPLYYIYLELYRIYNTLINQQNRISKQVPVAGKGGKSLKLSIIKQIEKLEPEEADIATVYTADNDMNVYIKAQPRLEDFDKELKTIPSIPKEKLNDIFNVYADYAVNIAPVPNLKNLVNPHEDDAELKKDLEDLTSSLAALKPLSA